VVFVLLRRLLYLNFEDLRLSCALPKISATAIWRSNIDWHSENLPYLHRLAARISRRPEEQPHGAETDNNPIADVKQIPLWS